ncbi:MAG: hypothetical protein GVY19_13025 [Bacteroidetes bacterium]|jgi:membrane-associated phospholipid phosphatase|nr:hypothetical protein [Bacteroidota bacterium]
MKSEKTLAEIISVVFNPLIMPTLGIIMLLQSGSFLTFLPAQVKYSILFITSASTFILPASFLPIFYYKGFLHGLGAESRQKRMIPLLLILVIYTIGYLWVYKHVPSATIRGFWLGFTLGVLLVFVISFFWKISAHMIGIGGIIGLILALWIRYQINLFNFLILAFVVAGLLGASRLRLNAHNIWQILGGFLGGILVVLFTVHFF